MRTSRHFLPGLLAALVLLAPACGSETTSAELGSSDSADPSESDTSSSSATREASPADPSDEPSSDPGDLRTEPTLEDLVSVTAAGGTVTTQPSPVDTTAEQAAYVADFDQRARGRLREAITSLSVPPGGTLTATVVAVGCDVPSTAEVSSDGDGWRVEAPTTKGSGVQCIAPITTVALVLLPEPGSGSDPGSAS